MIIQKLPENLLKKNYSISIKNQFKQVDKYKKDMPNIIEIIFGYL